MLALTVSGQGEIRGWFPAGPVPVASWLPLRSGLTPHGLRHGHQTGLDDLGIRYVLQAERPGHELPGMRGIYSYVTDGMRAELQGGLQEFWESSLSQRASLVPQSAVAVLDDLLTSVRHTEDQDPPPIRSQNRTPVREGERQ